METITRVPKDEFEMKAAVAVFRVAAALVPGIRLSDVEVRVVPTTIDETTFQNNNFANWSLFVATGIISDRVPFGNLGLIVAGGFMNFAADRITWASPLTGDDDHLSLPDQALQRFDRSVRSKIREFLRIHDPQAVPLRS